MNDRKLQIGLLIFPQVTQLDATAPFEVFARIPNTQVHLVWKALEPVISDAGLTLTPTMTIKDCPPLDLICVPGGPGQVDLMNDTDVIRFLKDQGKQAQYVTSVCTGALLLGAAGLLEGYEATTHWASMDNLPLFGARPVSKRVSIDRNRITGGGITAGLDFALHIAGIICGRDAACEIELDIEYNPCPPFGTGSPDKADKALVERARAALAPLLARRKEASIQASHRLGTRSP